ncbi:GPI mannosyltransferase, partial [Lachnellula willkommii]
MTGRTPAPGRVKLVRSRALFTTPSLPLPLSNQNNLSKHSLFRPYTHAWPHGHFPNMSTSVASPPLRKKPTSEDSKQPSQNEHVKSLLYNQRCSDIWMLLLGLRFINALCVRTFFQPDEYFQSLEPAWQMAFGSESGAWITWASTTAPELPLLSNAKQEWQHQLRSSLHPALFAAVYYSADKLMEFVSCFPQFRATILAVLPNVVQAYFAAVGDYYTWQLSEKIYGRGSNASWASLLMTIFSPWQWFCSTRTFSNCLETTMTITALNFWPWKFSSDSILDDSSGVKEKPVTPAKTSIFEEPGSVKGLITSLLLAGTACILRPTNALIWFSIVMATITRFFSDSRLKPSDYLFLIRQAVLCGSVIFFVSGISDRLYFGEWTFPPYQFLNFNVNQDLAVFYGRNVWHYYLSQGLPFLLTTYLPFAIVGLWNSASLPTGNIRFLLTTTILVTVSTLSLIAHKEVRFIYPLLPLLHILSAPSITTFFHTAPKTPTTHPPPILSTPITSQRTTTTTTIHRKPLLALLVVLNLSIAAFTTQNHQRGVLNVLTFLRHEYETSHPTLLDSNGALQSKSSSHNIATETEPELFAAFLMPCHSTPWRSKLSHASLNAWALTCEPPLHLAAHTPERAAYRDEADRFY